MKKYIYIIITLLAFTSCNKFLNVKPQSQIDRDQLFKTEQGFREALNGVYTFCATQALYGGNLTFGKLDILAQNYTFTDPIAQSVANFDYTQLSTVNNINDIWASCYRGIANCNYILAAIDQQKGVFTDNNYKLIKGETLALRAYLHFDALRMFAPSYKNGPKLRGIPFVTKIDVKSTPFSTVSVVIDSLLADLNTAKGLLKTTDPIMSSSYIVGYPKTDNITEDTNSDLFLQNRRHRLNYYAVLGELARVYLYKNDNVNALANAEEVIKANKFPFTKQEDFFQNDIEKKDRIFYPELIASWFIDNKVNNDAIKFLFYNNNPQYRGTVDQVNDIYEKGQSGAEDWRLKQWFVSTTNPTGGQDIAVLQKYIKNADPLKNRHPLVAPAIRLSEMYYIASEASYDTNPAQALTYFNTIRQHRGIGSTVNAVTSKDELVNLLLKDARKEFYGESQVFFMYKRLNHAVTISVTQSKAPSNQIFVFPIPVDELAYQGN
jgi:hypothetical protein